ncbi:hypothetical protein TNCV_4917451 [Trichonephila clavipes]|nr:hypothetical protein TNCV_4917451 [Trichonephila clavipes]
MDNLTFMCSTGQGYRDVILALFVRLFRGAYGLNAILMSDKLNPSTQVSNNGRIPKIGGYRMTGDDEVHFWLNDYGNKQNCRIWSEANPQVYVETPLHPEKLTVWCALRAGGILLQKR